MTEPPIEVGTESVEPRARRVGHRWLDLSIACIAIVVSMISLGVGFYNAQSQQRMVAATSWPFLMYETSRSKITEGGTIKLRISNQGVGPARLKSLVVRHDGRSVHGLIELLNVCCGLPAESDWKQLDKLGLVIESRPVSLYRPGDGVDIVVLEKTAQNTAVWDKLDQERLHLSFEACYCSVLGDCWMSDLNPVDDPKPVRQCAAVDGYRE